MFFWNSPAFSIIQSVLAIWYLVPLPFLNPACTSGSSWFIWNLMNSIRRPDYISFPYSSGVGFPGGPVVKTSSAMQETQTWSLGWEEPLEEEMAAHSSILAWRIPWTEEPHELESMGSQRVRCNWVWVCVCVCVCVCAQVCMRVHTHTHSGVGQGA